MYKTIKKLIQKGYVLESLFQFINPRYIFASHTPDFVLYYNVRKTNFGDRSLQREKRFMFSLVFLFGLVAIGIVFGVANSRFNLDTRNKASGKTYFVENNQDLQGAINLAADSDAIFLKVGSYTTSNPEGFVIKDKSIRILGAGKEFVTVYGTNNSNVFTLQNSNVKFENIKITGANKEGVLVQNTTANTEVQFKDVEISNNSGPAIISNAKLSVQTSTIDQNGAGIKSTGGLTLENSLIENSADYGVSLSASTTSSNQISNTIIAANKAAGISVEGSGPVQIKNVTVYGNDSGIVEKTATTSTTVLNSIIQGSKKEGVSFKGTNSYAKYTNSYANAGGDFKPESIKSLEGNTSIDAQFASTTDYHLASTSPLLHKGSGADANTDGSRVDMGAFGGSVKLATVMNSAPVITSTPPQYIKPGQTYNYEIKATDPDGDALSYIVVNSDVAPKWVKQSNNKFSGTPVASDIGFAGIVVVVTDRHGHNIVHPISINVLPSDRNAPPETATPTSAPQTNVVPQITFVSPKSGTIVSKDKNNEIKWTVNAGANIDKYVIKYSDDKSNFQTLTTLPGTATSYKWDLGNLVSGKYILQIEATDKGTPPVTVKKISDEFEVQNKPKTSTVPGTEITITKNNPADNDNVPTRKPLISVEFKPDADLDDSKTFLKVNGENVQFKKTRSTIYYEPQKEINGSKVKVETKIVTKEGATDQKSWSFTLPANTVPQDTTVTPKESSTILGLPRPIGLLILGILILGLLFLILYFITKLLKTIREERQGNLEAEFTEYYDEPKQTQQVVDPITSTTTTETTTTTQTANAYLATPEQANDYYIADAAPVAETKTAPVEQTTTVEKTVVTEPVTSEVTEAPAAPAESVTVEEVAPVETAVTDVAQSTSTTTTTQTDTDKDGVVDTKKTTTTTTEPVLEEGMSKEDYINSLKSKYGITEEDIQEYKDTQENTDSPQTDKPAPKKKS